eukprot:scaffold4390_cov108-Isochrysis_galbana.AAC.2
MKEGGVVHNQSPKRTLRCGDPWELGLVLVRARPRRVVLHVRGLGFGRPCVCSGCCGVRLSIDFVIIAGSPPAVRKAVNAYRSLASFQGSVQGATRPT